MDRMMEILDQAAHWFVGWVMGMATRSVPATREEKIEAVMEFPKWRESKQHPDGKQGSGSRRDMLYWRRGAEAGVGDG